MWTRRIPYYKPVCVRIIRLVITKCEIDDVLRIFGECLCYYFELKLLTNIKESFIVLWITTQDPQGSQWIFYFTMFSKISSSMLHQHKTLILSTYFWGSGFIPKESLLI